MASSLSHEFDFRLAQGKRTPLGVKLNRCLNVKAAWSTFSFRDDCESQLRLIAVRSVSALAVVPEPRNSSKPLSRGFRRAVAIVRRGHGVINRFAKQYDVYALDSY